MGNLYYIYRFSYHIFSGGIILLINCQKNIIQHSYLYLQIRRHYCILPPSWLLLRASSMALLLATYMVCKHYTLTWACQIHSKMLSACINVFRLYIFSLIQSLISWPLCMICWYWPSLYTSFLCSKSYRLP